MKKIYSFIFICLFVEYNIIAQTERDPWLWPFSQNSIWNTPIGSNAKYEPANLTKASYVSVDHERHIKVKDTDPIQNVLEPSSWNKRWPGGKILGSMRVPDDLIIPDATSSDTPNECCSFLQPDGRTIKQLEPACRVQKYQHIVGYLWSEDIDLYGEGIGGTHFGSGLSTLGGSIRLGELIGDEPIKHVIKWEVWGKQYLYYSSSIRGYKWPADRSDNYASSNYGGINPKLVQGSLLALHPDLDINSLNLKTKAAKKIAKALQDYGAYICDDTGWNAFSIPMEFGVKEEVLATDGAILHTNSGDYFDDINKIAVNLYIVTNNSSASIGGGGTPRAPLAPPFIGMGSNNMKKQDITASPNPANDYITIANEKFNGKNVHVEIFDMLSHLVYQTKQYSTGTLLINFGKLAPGIYSVVANVETNYFITKISVINNY